MTKKFYTFTSVLFDRKEYAEFASLGFDVSEEALTSISISVTLDLNSIIGLNDYLDSSGEVSGTIIFAESGSVKVQKSRSEVIALLKEHTTADFLN